MSSNPIRQSGNITPGHVAVWTTDGVIADGGTSPQPPQTKQSFVEQSGSITPGHIAKFTSTSVIADAGLFSTIDAILVSGLVVTETTRAVAEASSIPVTVTALQTFGYATLGDGGGAFYTRQVSDPGVGGFQSLDGAWWGLTASATGDISVKMFGAKGDDATDDTTAIQDALDFTHDNGGGLVNAPEGTYKTTSQITFSYDVGIRGSGRNSTILSVHFAGIGYVWTGAVSTLGAGTISELTFQGNDVALAGLIVGEAQNFMLMQVDFEHFVDDGLVLAGTQNSTFLQVFGQACGTNFRLAGNAWNNIFIRCGSNVPVNYHLWSKYDAGYIAAAGSTAGIRNRHNTWIHPIYERGSPINLIRFEDDDGDNSFYDAELIGGSSGNPQIYIGVNSINNMFLKGNVALGGVSGLTYAFDIHGFGTQILTVDSPGWSATDWILVTSPGTVNVEGTTNSGTILDASARSYQENNAFSGGAYGHVVADGFTFFRARFDGVAAITPALTCSTGKITPAANKGQDLGGEAYLWNNIWSKSIFLGAGTFAQLPANAAGYIAQITDSTANTWGAIVSGGGTGRVLAWNNGLNWTVIGI